MHDLDAALLEAYSRLRPKLLSDPAELDRRRRRRDLATLARPPRAWCCAVRASDTRIESCAAQDELDPSRKFAHRITLDAALLRKLCRPVTVDWPGEDWQHLAGKLGCRAASLKSARDNGVFSVRYVQGLGGKRGYPVPILYSDAIFDPGAGNLRRPAHPIWGNRWPHLADLVPEHFEHRLVREPCHRMFKGDRCFRGWHWVCPICRKRIRTVYLPIPMMTVPQFLGDDAFRDFFARPPRINGFACVHCHRIQRVSGIERTLWNTVVAHFTGGLLYGREVRKPDGYVFHRQRNYTPQLDRPAPRRQQVLRRLLNGWTNRQIAANLGVSERAVDNHLRILCRQEHVPDRHGLVRKLNPKRTLPPNQVERAAARRKRIESLLLAGRSYRQIMSELNVDFSTVNRDACKIYRKHDVNGRRSLQRKLESVTPTIHDRRREQILRLLVETAAPRPAIAQSLGLPLDKVCYHIKMIYREHRVHGREELRKASFPQNVAASPHAARVHGRSAQC